MSQADYVMTVIGVAFLLFITARRDQNGQPEILTYFALLF